MKMLLSICFFILISILVAPAQSIDDSMPFIKMKADLELFKSIRESANSGLYKYRSSTQIDSIYNWAFERLKSVRLYREFYSVICHLTDYEGSLHNDTALPKTIFKQMRLENSGYFPFPLKQIGGKMLLNLKDSDIPLGAEIIAINNVSMDSIIPSLFKYYTTDGINTSGKFIGINYNFAKYYRIEYGLTDFFEVTYRLNNTSKIEKGSFKSISFLGYYERVDKRYSKPFDDLQYNSSDEIEKYSFQIIGKGIGKLTINSFAMGSQGTREHEKYLHFLDSVFLKLKIEGTKHLIVDVRNNGGGTDPNDLVTYSYLTDRDFSENRSAWISFEKVPYYKYNIDNSWPFFIRTIIKNGYNKYLKEEFPEKRKNGFYQNETSDDHKARSPEENVFKGAVYLLISPRVASAGSLFAAMLAGNENTTVIGEETMGGYYGHNGHTSIAYKLPNSNLAFSFSIVNLEQDVPLKNNQFKDRGIMPDFEVTQSYQDFLSHTDVQLEFALKLIK